MIRARAFAKVNLSLHVGAATGPLHPLHGLFQSIGWADRLTLERAEVDAIVAPGDRPVIDGWANLAWQAADAMRSRQTPRLNLALTLDKQIPVAAGLGGGSADAAAALAMAGRMFNSPPEVLADLAPNLGSDVPFCLSGGLAWVSGTGERVEPLEARGGYALGLVVPPVEVATVAVYAAWDRLGGPTGPTTDVGDVPPSLREHAPLHNDLYPAAVAVAPEIDEWRLELQRRWSRPVLLTGSGPTLFAFFVDPAEAEAALDVVPPGGRATYATEPVANGWRFEDDEDDDPR